MRKLTFAVAGLVFAALPVLAVDPSTPNDTLGIDLKSDVVME
ncbi:hypothetical protein [Anianabacter salinae]|nr:hypothetical protein [Anianabacter salinae]